MDQETLTNESSSALQPLRQPDDLPPEILAEILLLTLPPLSKRQAPQMNILSLVCRFWHLLVDSTPTLWSRISIADKISYVQKALSKSGEHPIDVCGDSYWLSVDWESGDNQTGSPRFLAEVQQHARRWRHVTLRLPPPERSTPAVAILPSLQTLKLYARHSSVLSDQLLPLLNRQHAPFLREVSLSGLRIRSLDLIWFPPTLSMLEISDIQENYPLIVGWLSIIAACPNLAVFRLSEIWMLRGDDVKDDENTVPDVVEPNALRELKLHDVSPSLIIGILMRLRLPEDCAISIRCMLPNRNPSTFFLSPALSRQRNFQRAGKVIQATIDLSQYSESVLVVYQRWRIRLDWSRSEVIRDALAWFGIGGEDSNACLSHSGGLQAGLATSNSPPVTLMVDGNWLRINFPKLGTISDLRNINRIDMNFSDYEARCAFQSYLSRPKDPNQPTRTMDLYLEPLEPELNQEVAGVWPFPGLSELVRRGLLSNVVHRVLVEPMTGQCSDDAPGTSGRAARWELREPNTPWEKVV